MYWLLQSVMFRYNRATMKSINSHQRKYLKGQAHTLNPVVTIGQNGLTDAVVAEVNQAVDHHELIKIKLPAGDKASRMAQLESAGKQVDAIVVTLIGRIGIIFKQAETSRFTLPN